MSWQAQDRCWQRHSSVNSYVQWVRERRIERKQCLSALKPVCPKLELTCLSVRLRETKRTNYRQVKPTERWAHQLERASDKNSGLCLSGRSYRIEELADFELEAVRVAGQGLRRREHLRRSRSGLAGAALHVGDVGGDLLGAVSGLLDVAGNFLGRRTLLFHRGGNGR